MSRQPTLPGFAPPQPPPEHDEQVAFIALCRTRACRDARAEALAYVAAVPNGAWYGKDRKLAFIIGNRMRAEGLAKGYPDVQLLIAMPRPADDPAPDGADLYHGWLGELKRLVGGRVEPEQATWHTWLRAQGYRVDVARGADALYAALCAYLGLPVEG